MTPGNCENKIVLKCYIYSKP
uniref:Uncharacterized protein n=1 Tax=Anguilla anguilla TaxID=7936 RepID=A0A0E9SP71_ANGAN